MEAMDNKKPAFTISDGLPRPISQQFDKDLLKGNPRIENKLINLLIEAICEEETYEKWEP